jgi:hypothetical protein
MTMTETEYQQRTEKRIDSLLEVIDELRQENDRLNAFVDLIAADVEWWEGRKASPKMQTVVKAYREIRTKKEG